MMINYHAFYHAAGTIEEAIEVHVNHTMPLLRFHHQHNLIIYDAGIIHQHVNIIIRMSGKPLIQSCIDSIRLANIKGHEFRFASGFFDEALGLLRRSMIGFIIEQDRASVFC